MVEYVAKDPGTVYFWRRLSRNGVSPARAVFTGIGVGTDRASILCIPSSIVYIAAVKT